MSEDPQYLGSLATFTRSPTLRMLLGTCPHSAHLKRARPYESSLDVVKETVCPATIIVHEDVSHEEYLTSVLGDPVVIVL